MPEYENDNLLCCCNGDQTENDRVGESRVNISFGTAIILIIQLSLAFAVLTCIVYKK